MKKEEGATLVEVALVLPFFFLMIFGAIDFTRIVVGYSSVRSAAAIGVRRGAALNRPQWPAFVTLGLPFVAVLPGDLNALTTFKSSDGDSSWYQNRATSLGVASLFPPEVRAIGYGTSIIGRSLGWTKFPCSGDNCVRCFPVRGDAAKFTNPLRGIVNSGYASRQLSLECTYDVPLLLSGLSGGFFGPFFTVRARAYTAMDETADRNYVP